MPEEITAALNSHDAQAALNMLHSLRGAAVTLSMKRLAAAGSHVEEAIRASRPVHDALGEYAKTLAQLEQALSPWLPPASKDPQDSPD